MMPATWLSFRECPNCLRHPQEDTNEIAFWTKRERRNYRIKFTIHTSAVILIRFVNEPLPLRQI
ncbi:hypothetical protein O77CONTIG1_04755 [Leptolyngbya sp. O-77]|nr:hypothetical protein O77CONTIG1_04755 [Leptolyngbya sp. O-77]